MRRRLSQSGHQLWSDRLGRVELRFVGRGPGDRTTAATAAGAPREVAWSRQIHSARILAATAAGPCGEGDALTTRRVGLALSVVTADCVPVLLAGDDEIAAVHAGWRGIEAGIVGKTIARLDTSVERLTAWLGPAIGPCCYEVGEEVAARVTAVSDPGVVVPGRGPRPHLDLHAAITSQLRRAGVGATRHVADCTRCSVERLWSYRREGPRAGRNLGFIWLRG